MNILTKNNISVEDVTNIINSMLEDTNDSMFIFNLNGPALCMGKNETDETIEKNYLPRLIMPYELGVMLFDTGVDGFVFHTKKSNHKYDTLCKLHNIINHVLQTHGINTFVNQIEHPGDYTVINGELVAIKHYHWEYGKLMFTYDNIPYKFGAFGSCVRTPFGEMYLFCIYFENNKELTKQIIRPCDCYNFSKFPESYIKGLNEVIPLNRDIVREDICNEIKSQIIQVL